MNDEPLPVLNGYPVRLVVPGWYATYWVKMLDDVEVINTTRRELLDESCLPHSGQSLCLHHARSEGEDCADQPLDRAFLHHQFRRRCENQGGQHHEVKGIAFDGGYGIARVLFSVDGGKSGEEDETR